VLPTPSESNPIITLRDFLPLQEHGRRTEILDEGYELDLERLGEDINEGVILKRFHLFRYFVLRDNPDFVPHTGAANIDGVILLAGTVGVLCWRL
jgi:hypothetical protein